MLVASPSSVRAGVFCLVRVNAKGTLGASGLFEFAESIVTGVNSARVDVHGSLEARVVFAGVVYRVSAFETSFGHVGGVGTNSVVFVFGMLDSGVHLLLGFVVPGGYKYFVLSLNDVRHTAVLRNVDSVDVMTLLNDVDDIINIFLFFFVLSGDPVVLVQDGLACLFEL